MSGSIDAINGSGMSLQFQEFARLAGRSSNVVRFLGSSDAATVHEVAVTKSDKVGKWSRSDDVKLANDTTRAIFRQSVAAMFGGESLIPENVKKAMKLDDYGKGKPLTAKRIRAVKIAVEKAMKMFPAAETRITAPTAQVRQGWPDGGPLSAQEVVKKGYAAGELKMLSDVADMYKKATGCSLEDAQKAALDPKSTARRLYSYGGMFTASQENFAKGLEIMDSFDKWFGDFVDREANTKSHFSLRSDSKLSIEKFLFEEIGCTPKLFNANTPEARFAPENNPAMRYILDNMMDAISGSMAGISPEKRSVVYAVSNALRDGGHPFTFNSAILSRTLANFGKVAELVYSGNLDRTTAFDTLFSDLKKLGLSSGNTNDEIATEVSEIARFAQEAEEAMSRGDYDLAHDLSVTKAFQLTNMFNTSGASLQDCKRAALNGRNIPAVDGMSNITAGIQDASGFTGAGRKQFVHDICRPTPPLDPKTRKPLIGDANNVFRFNINGQLFTAKTDRDQTLDQKGVDAFNQGIANAIAKLCGEKVHPIQTNAVFFALSQGALMPQTSLASHGYLAADHGPVTYTITNDAQTGNVTIKYANPEGSPLKFSWTATVDLEGKVVATPIQIEKK